MTTTTTQRPVTDQRPRCWKCRRILALVVTRPWEIRCSRCKSQNGHPIEAAPSQN